MELAEYRRMHALEERHWWFRAKRRMVYALLRAWCPGGRVLDLGCGTGLTLRDLPPGYLGLGIDPSGEALELCRERGLARLVRGSATEIPLAARSLDAVLALDIVEHIEDDVAALREIARVLRPGGAAVVTVPAFPWLWSSHDAALHHKRRYTRRSLEARLSEAGLNVALGGFAQATIFAPAALLRLARRWLGGGRSSSSAGSDVRENPGWLDALAFRLVGWEVPLVLAGRLPVGLSLAYVVYPAHASAAQKPARAGGERDRRSSAGALKTAS